MNEFTYPDPPAPKGMIQPPRSLKSWGEIRQWYQIHGGQIPVNYKARPPVVPRATRRQVLLAELAELDYIEWDMSDELMNQFRLYVGGDSYRLFIGEEKI